MLPRLTPSHCTWVLVSVQDEHLLPFVLIHSFVSTADLRLMSPLATRNGGAIVWRCGRGVVGSSNAVFGRPLPALPCCRFFNIPKVSFRAGPTSSSSKVSVQRGLTVTFSWTRSWSTQLRLKMEGVASGASAPSAAYDADGQIQDDTLGELNERFTMLKQFSTNTKTTVYLARAVAADDPAAAAAGGQNVVIKILAPAYARPEDSSQPPNEVQIAEVSRFRREYQRLSRIDHPNVVRYVSFGLLDGWRPYMILEAISGSDVQRILDKKRWLTETETVGIVRGVLKALSALHLQGIIHRDIKPANIMVTVSAPFVKLIDFGFARMLEADGEIPPEENKIIGTPMYWAPEQTFARNTVTGALDLWAVGVLMFHLSSGVLPFSSHNGKLMQIAEGIRTKPARDLSAMSDGRVSPRFCVLCHRFLSTTWIRALYQSLYLSCRTHLTHVLPLVTPLLFLCD